MWNILFSLGSALNVKGIRDTHILFYSIYNMEFKLYLTMIYDHTDLRAGLRFEESH